MPSELDAPDPGARDLEARLDAIDGRLARVEELLGRLIMDGDAARGDALADTEALAEVSFGMTRVAARLEAQVEAALAVLERIDEASTTARSEG